MSETPFHLYLWPERLLMLAPAYASARHRHHAAQIAFGLDGPVTFETPQTGTLQADMLLIPPDQIHAHPAFGASASLFLEPQGEEWAQLCACRNNGLAPLPFDVRLRPLARSAAEGDASAAQALVRALVGTSAGETPGDELVARACAYVRGHLGGTITLAALAAALHRSPSRLAHRFRTATGVPLRRYVLWCRLRAAVEAAMRGVSLTDAAHASGFADSAHLSRTFRAMFGVAPSFLFRPGRIRATFLDSTAG